MSNKIFNKRGLEKSLSNALNQLPFFANTCNPVTLTKSNAYGKQIFCSLQDCFNNSPSTSSTPCTTGAVFIRGFNGTTPQNTTIDYNSTPVNGTDELMILPDISLPPSGSYGIMASQTEKCKKFSIPGQKLLSPESENDRIFIKYKLQNSSSIVYLDPLCSYAAENGNEYESLFMKIDNTKSFQGNISASLVLQTGISTFINNNTFFYNNTAKAISQNFSVPQNICFQATLNFVNVHGNSLKTPSEITLSNKDNDVILSLNKDCSNPINATDTIPSKSGINSAIYMKAMYRANHSTAEVSFSAYNTNGTITLSNYSLLAENVVDLSIQSWNIDSSTNDMLELSQEDDMENTDGNIVDLPKYAFLDRDHNGAYIKRVLQDRRMLTPCTIRVIPQLIVVPRNAMVQLAPLIYISSGVADNIILARCKSIIKKSTDAGNYTGNFWSSQYNSTDSLLKKYSSVASKASYLVNSGKVFFSTYSDAIPASVSQLQIATLVACTGVADYLESISYMNITISNDTAQLYNGTNILAGYEVCSHITGINTLYTKCNAFSTKEETKLFSDSSCTTVLSSDFICSDIYVTTTVNQSQINLSGTYNGFMISQLIDVSLDPTQSNTLRAADNVQINLLADQCNPYVNPINQNTIITVNGPIKIFSDSLCKTEINTTISKIPSLGTFYTLGTESGNMTLIADSSTTKKSNIHHLYLGIYNPMKKMFSMDPSISCYGLYPKSKFPDCCNGADGLTQYVVGFITSGFINDTKSLQKEMRISGESLVHFNNSIKNITMVSQIGNIIAGKNSTISLEMPSGIYDTYENGTNLLQATQYHLQFESCIDGGCSQPTNICLEIEPA